MGLDLSSKFLLFLSFQTVHQIQCGIILHHAFQLLLPSLLIQQLIKFAVCSGMVQFVFVRPRKMAQICVVKLQCKNKCLLFSSAFPHNEHQDTIVFPFSLTLHVSGPSSDQPYKAFYLSWY